MSILLGRESPTAILKSVMIVFGKNRMMAETTMFESVVPVMLIASAVALTTKSEPTIVFMTSMRMER